MNIHVCMYLSLSLLFSLSVHLYLFTPVYVYTCIHIFTCIYSIRYMIYMYVCIFYIYMCVCKHTLRTIIRWDADDIDGQRMLAEARQKEANLQALKATAESLMLEILQKILEIEENMEVCAANSHTNKQLKYPNTRTRFHWSSYHSHKRIASAWIPTVDTHNQKKPYHVQPHPPHESHPPFRHICIQVVVDDGEECRQGQRVIMSRRFAVYERYNQYAGWVGVLQSRVSPGVWLVHFPAMHLESTIQLPIAKHEGVCV